MGELNGKSMLVVGASPGIGRAICARLVSEGATVHVADINATLAQETATAVGAIAYSFDCTNRESTRVALSGIGKLDAMVCIVATFFPPDAEGRITEDQWRKTFEINLLSNMVVADEAAKVIDEGSIVLVSSANAVVAKKGSWAYDTSKAALNHLIREMAVEFAPRIRVNGIAPATVVEGSQQFPRERTMTSLVKYGVAFEESESTEELRSKLAEFYAQRTLLKAKVTPNAVAEAVFLLVSDRLKLTTGHILPVDAGLAEGFLR